MGCCISKCKPKRSSKYKEESNNLVQDKLVISQAASSSSPSPPPHPHVHLSKENTKTFPFPSSPSPSSSSLSSFSCTCSHGNIKSCSSSSSSSTITSTSTSSSTASSLFLTSKDQKHSFSNEFLYSCVKENPHVLRSPKPRTQYNQKLNSSLAALSVVQAPTKQSIPPVRSIKPSPSPSPPLQQKRARASSPNLTRQKSFRRENERSNSTYSSLQNRTPPPPPLMRSPSPSRRFNGENCRNLTANSQKDTYSKRASIGSSMRKENIRPASPNNNSSSKHWSSLRNQDTRTHGQIGSKNDENEVGEVLSNMEIDSIPIEDVNNPHISLDCFIFL